MVEPKKNTSKHINSWIVSERPNIVFLSTTGHVDHNIVVESNRFNF